MRGRRPGPRSGPGRSGDAGLVEFARRYGAAPTHEVTVPGRVNLIGEHIDYCGLPVLPMAIERRIRLLLRPRADPRVRLATIEPGAGARSFRLDGGIEPYGPGDWGNYPKAAARTLLDGGKLAEAPDPRGLDGLVTSDLPVAAGLSSSSALVVACALGLLATNDPRSRRSERRRPGSDRDRLELAGRLAEGERFVGTAGGGMDQAACLLARAGHALRIEFGPLRATHVPVPQRWRFVVAHSLERAEKSGRARAAYNARTRECAAALDRVRRHLGLGDAIDYAALLERVEPGRLVDAGNAALEAPLRARFRHVVTEARRVAAAADAMRRGDLARFGDLLSASHASLRDDYEVSTPALDRLVEVAMDAGAAGARLTGAGLGGCAICVCEAGRVGRVRDALRTRFYEGRAEPERLEPPLFEVTASAGAAVRPT